MFWEGFLSILELRYPDVGVTKPLCNSNLTTTAPKIALILQWGLLLIVLLDYGFGEVRALLRWHSQIAVLFFLDMLSAECRVCDYGHVCC
ncbi:hypothetical protein Nepgr_015870 [Nepenthes gracilis]|uniref:Uncharacterized protein n=1 Tax=Nepenthes gracilis TaxID=150966 RepID=A0AAD3SNJ5_NEPGR|nr:hypothetical protein Nepgr_015870 [Nepenthes gracilis]